MKARFKSAIAGGISLLFAGAGFAVLATPAYAAQSAPPWEADANAATPYGNVVFYDANGNQVTSGTNLANAFAYAVGATGIDSGATKASLAFAQVLPPPATPSTWSVGAASGTTTWSSLTSVNTPASVFSSVNTDPVVTVGTTGANITSFASSFPSSLTAGYVDIIQVRLTDSGPGAGNASGTYWESDIAYNQTGSQTTVDGTTVPANGWAQLFPFNTASTTGLTTNATGGHLNSGTAITLTATVPSADAGTVNFFDGTTLLGSGPVSTGTASFSYTPAVGSHSYTANFIPLLGDETGAGTTSASIVDESTSPAVPVTDSAPLIGTSSALSANPTSVAFNGSSTLTATVSAADNSTTGVAGTVQFLDGSTALGSPQATTVTGAGTLASPGVGTATLVNTTWPQQGANNITAVFTPTNAAYGTSPASNTVVVTEAAPTICASPSVCSEPQGITVTVNPGTITISTPYTSTNPFVLPAMTLSSDNTYLQSSAEFPATTGAQIVVTSSLAPAYAWTLSVAATPLTSGGNSIPASGLGLTNGNLLNATGTGAYPGTVTFVAGGIPALNPSPVDGPGTGPGLSATPQSWAHSSASDGTAEMDGTLTLDASTGTPAGTYSGTITFSVS